MRLRYIVLSIIAILLISKLKAQDSGLGIGAQVPDFVIGKIINASGKELKISDFKDQLLIIDFWTTNCPGCVEALPKMEALQQQFGNKIKILPVTYEKESLVSRFWKQNNYTKKLSLSSVVEDKQFATYFRHQTIPHEVWVYRGKVIAITTASYVDAANITRVLNGELVNWPVKNDFYRFDQDKPLFVTDPNQIDTSNTFIKYSAISDYKEGVNSEGQSGGAGILRDTVNKTVRSYFLNQPIFTSYWLLFGKVGKPGSLVKPVDLVYTPNQILWKVKDRSRYIYEPAYGYEQDWIRKHAICFESVNPDRGQTEQQVNAKMITELNLLLGLNVRWEKKKEKVWILINGSRVGEKSNSGKSIKASALGYFLNQQQDNPYVFNELTGAMEEMKLNVTSWTDLAVIRKAIAPYGFDIIEKERIVDKLVFEELDGGLLSDPDVRTDDQPQDQSGAKVALTIQVKPNWYNLDLKENGVFGISMNKAYSELLKDKKVVPVTVAVIDGGTDTGHEDLKGSLWVNPKEIAGNGKDDDGNSYVDDCYGWNFMGSSKGSFHHDNKEVVRILRAGINHDPLSEKTKELKSTVATRLEALNGGLKTISNQWNTLQKINRSIGKEHPDIADFKAYKYKTADEAKVIFMVVKGLKENPDFMHWFEDRYHAYQNQVKYYMDVSYDPRAGNAEYLNQFYGNGDVKGLEPSHGSHVAGIIAAVRGNGIGIDGVAADARIMTLRAIPDGDPLDADLANAIRYAVDNGAKVINLSTGKDKTSDRSLLDEAVRYAMKKDVLIVHAAGNSGKELEPGTIFPARNYLNGGKAEAWLEVGASAQNDDADIVSSFSNFGVKTVDVFAPGAEIKSAWWPGKYMVKSGTSMAAPVVSGLAAEIRAHYPKLTAIQVKDIIMKSVIKRDSLKDKCISGGVINAYEALKLAATYAENTRI